MWDGHNQGDVLPARELVRAACSWERGWRQVGQARRLSGALSRAPAGLGYRRGLSTPGRPLPGYDRGNGRSATLLYI